MNSVGILFVVVMVILSGVIAYLGDLLGRYLGKKRKTIFGLRPRHFAALATGLAGAFAAGMVILVLSLVSAPIKQFIIEGNRAQRELIQKQGELEAAKNDLNETDRLRQQAEAKLADADSRLADAEKKLADEVKNVDEARRLAADLRGQVEALQKQAASFEADLRASRGELQAARQELIQVEKDLTDAEEQQQSTLKITNDLLKQNQQMDQDLQAADNELQERQRRVDELQGQVDGLQKNIDSLQEAYQRELADNTKALNEVRGELNAANADLEAARLELANVQKTLDEAKRTITGTNLAARTRRLVANYGDELVRVPLDPQMSMVEARGLLRVALENASTEARLLGASAKEGAPGVFASFIDAQTSSLVPISAQAQFEMTVNRMAGGQLPRFMVLRTPYNTFEGEFIPIEVEVYANTVVYQAGETIMETRIDGSRTDDEVADAITEFITDVLQAEVLADGVVPARGKPSPLGELDRETFLNMVEDLRRANRPMTVSFISKTMTRRGDKLQLDFRLRP